MIILLHCALEEVFLILNYSSAVKALKWRMYYKFNVIGNKDTTKRVILSSYKLLRIACTLRDDIILLDAVRLYRGKHISWNQQYFHIIELEMHKDIIF